MTILVEYILYTWKPLENIKQKSGGSFSTEAILYRKAKKVLL